MDRIDNFSLAYRKDRPIFSKRGGEKAMMRKNGKGFTLIELLIVVAIIGILAAIAIPNFLQAQVRAKVARTKGEMRTLAQGIELYNVDNGKYPDGSPQYPEGYVKYRLWRLTTPVEYVTSLPDDPFKTRMTAGGGQPQDEPSFIYLMKNYHPFDYYFDTTPAFRLSVPFRSVQWTLSSQGPEHANTNWITWIPYDPTNGTVSMGEIISFGPGGPFAENSK
jgi:type II secretion system protein G